MMQTTRNWRVLGVIVGVIAAVGFSGTTASADPLFPPQPTPAPPTVTQTVSPGAVADSTSGTAPAATPAPAPVPLLPGVPTPAAAPVPLPSGVPTPAAGPVPPVQPQLIPATTGTLRDYFQGKGVQLEAQKPQGFNALDIALPMPAGWTQVPDPNVIDPFIVIANRSSKSVYTSNAQVVVYKLIGDFDSNEAITHGFVDSRQLPGWRTTRGSLADFGGFPSSIIEGTYRQNDMTLNTSRRHVIASSGPDKYLVSLAVTTAVNQAVAEAPATDAIVRGFRVAVPGSSPGPAESGPPPSPQPDPVPSPAATVAPQ
ncbi:MAG: LpqN/LpqT family lipoprotein [Mycobacterium sp.]|nr:LpqN/LpqT family lipoprotein [Mycobacterium sp.]